MEASSQLAVKPKADGQQLALPVDSSRATIVGPGQWNNVSQLKNLKPPPNGKNLIAASLPTG